jgi:hypothetical protein
MADDLVDVATESGIPEYKDIMAQYAQKLQLLDQVKGFMGKTATVRENRAESFVSTLFGKNKTERVKAIQGLSDLFGEDFIKMSKLANLAAQLGDEGVAGILPRQFTGRSLLGGSIAAGASPAGPLAIAAPLVLSSPRGAAATLAATGGIEKGLKKTAEAIPQPFKLGTRQALRSQFRKDDQ